MSEEFNMSMRKFLKQVGVTSQQKNARRAPDALRPKRADTFRQPG